jgi:hypothetical protein
MPSTVAEITSGSTPVSSTSSSVDESDSSRSPKGFESESLSSDAVASGSESVANSESPSVVGGAEDDDDAAVSDGIEEMAEADETDSDNESYVPSLEDSDMLRR